MSADWIKMQKSLPDKPEVWAIAAALNLDSDTVVGKLFRVWSWFDEHTQDGVAQRSIKLLLDKNVGVQGFCDSMISSGWMLEDEKTISLPNFGRHNSATAKERATGAKRTALHRKKKACNGDVTESVERQVIPRPIRTKVYERDGHACVYCGRGEGEHAPTEAASDGELSVDHVIPVTRGGSNEISNLVTACVPCNNFKNNRTPEEAGLDWPEDVTGNRYGSVTKALPEKIREDISIPDGIDKGAWTDYETYRAGLPKKNRLTEKARKIAWGMLAKHSMPDQKQIIETSIMNGWTGLFPPKGGPNGQTHHEAKPNAFDRSKQRLREWERQQSAPIVVDGEVVGAND